MILKNIFVSIQDLIDQVRNNRWIISHHPDRHTNAFIYKSINMQENKHIKILQFILKSFTFLLDIQEGTEKFSA